MGKLNCPRDDSQSFFSSLGSFCKTIDQEIKIFQKDMLKTPGSYPQDYNTGVKTLQRNMDEIKTLDGDISKKLNVINEFGLFTESLQEMVEQQQEDIRKMELYLEKFGYKIPVQESIIEEEPSMNEENTEANDLGLISPVLNYNNEPKKFISEPVMELNLPNTPKPLKATPQSSQTVPYCYTPSSVSNKSRYYIHKWLEDVSRDNAEGLTPSIQGSIRSRTPGMMFQEDFYCTPLPRMEELKENISPIDYKSVALEEHMRKNYTPEEPSISGLSKSFLNKEMDCKNTRRYTPEEPIMSAMTSSLLKTPSKNTPEEPVLSNATMSILNRPTNFKLKGPTLSELDCTDSISLSKNTPSGSCFKDSHHYSRNILKQKSGFSEEEFLKSPELSEVTRNILKSCKL